MNSFAEKRRRKLWELVQCIRGDSSTIPEGVERLARQTSIQVYEEPVFNKLDGLVEKFEVLGRSDLSRALEARLSAVKVICSQDFHSLELLAMILQCSRDPIKAAMPDLELENVQPADDLTWQEILDNDPFTGDHWLEPDYDDTLSEWSLSSRASTSEELIAPTPHQDRPVENTGLVTPPELPSHDVEKEILVDRMARGAYWSGSQHASNQEPKSLAESDILRECTLVLLGYPVYLFETTLSGTVTLDERALINTDAAHLSSMATRSILKQVAGWASMISHLRLLSSGTLVLKRCSSFNYAPLFGLLENLVRDIDVKILSMEESFFNDPNDIVSLTNFLFEISSFLKPYSAVSDIVEEVLTQLNGSSLGAAAIVLLMDLLLFKIARYEISGDQHTLRLLVHLFIAVFDDYLFKVGLVKWLDSGTVSQENKDSFLLECDDMIPDSLIWQQLCHIKSENVPAFLKEQCTVISDTGKVSRLLTKMGITDRITPFSFKPSQNFSRDFELAVNSWILIIAEQRNRMLRLHSQVPYRQLIDTIQQVYFVTNTSFMLDFLDSLYIKRIVNSAMVNEAFDDTANDNLVGEKYPVSWVLSNGRPLPKFQLSSIVCENMLSSLITQAITDIFRLRYALAGLEHKAVRETPRRFDHICFLNALKCYTQLALISSKPPSFDSFFQKSVHDLDLFIKNLSHQLFLDDKSFLPAIERGHLGEALAKITEYPSFSPMVQTFKRHVHHLLS